MFADTGDDEFERTKVAGNGRLAAGYLSHHMSSTWELVEIDTAL